MGEQTSLADITPQERFYFTREGVRVINPGGLCSYTVWEGQCVGYLPYSHEGVFKVVIFFNQGGHHPSYVVKEVKGVDRRMAFRDVECWNYMTDSHLRFLFGSSSTQPHLETIMGILDGPVMYYWAKGYCRLECLHFTTPSSEWYVMIRFLESLSVIPIIKFPLDGKPQYLGLVIKGIHEGLLLDISPLVRDYFREVGSVRAFITRQRSWGGIRTFAQMKEGMCVKPWTDLTLISRVWKYTEFIREHYKDDPDCLIQAVRGLG